MTCSSEIELDDATLALANSYAAATRINPMDYLMANKPKSPPNPQKPKPRPGY